MITGLVTVDREAIIRLVVRGPGDREFGIDTAIDTGFDRRLSLPSSLQSSSQS
jgi:predicted aspartyl protease